MPPSFFMARSGMEELVEALLVVIVIDDGWQCAADVVEQVCACGPATPYRRMSRLKRAWPHALPAAKVVAKSSRDEATSSQAKNVSLLRKKSKIPYTKKTQVRSVPSSLPKSNISLMHIAERRSAHDPAVESRAFKRGIESASLTSLEVRMAVAKKTRESSIRWKGSSATSVDDPKVDKFSPAGDASVSNLAVECYSAIPTAVCSGYSAILAIVCSGYPVNPAAICSCCLVIPVAGGGCNVLTATIPYGCSEVSTMKP
ncbi:hypothetical protein L3X38_038019 [Prunus dulcis]|uniref:Uncharacterized protein n=1 Tax=Prunus dulcis TaxID=3755 RepID=A0AAD4V5S5_PRUDU|nr:hypothetical protein L3X38_038019 [Prunus dulcis]